MKICFICKYPPIQGGVSSSTYWLAHGLAAKGHQIHVVTNANEVEDLYAIRFAEDDWRHYEPQFHDTGGSVRVYNASPYSHRAMSHIPRSNPFVTKLAGLATQIIRSKGCDLVFAYYYEPYAVAGWLASQWTGKPLVVKHAGSDLERLFSVPDLATAYKEILRSASAVVTQQRLFPRFLGMGVKPERLEADIAYSIPSMFSPDGPRLDLAGSIERVDGLAAAEDVGDDVAVVGIYGKVGESKGTYDLIAALGRLRAAGLEFRLLAMIGNAQLDYIRPALQDASIADWTGLLPLLPNWRVPEFHRRCTVVCFLERDFPVAIHGPMVPREILASGACMVVSKEILDKQRFKDAIVSGRNAVVIEDPKQVPELAAALEPLLRDRALARAIGQAGAALSRSIEDSEVHANGWEAIFQRQCAPAPAQAQPSVADAIRTIAPELVALVESRFPDSLKEFAAGQPDTSRPLELTERLCAFVRRELEADNSGASPQLQAAVRYLELRFASMYDPEREVEPAFSITDRVADGPMSEDAIARLYPVRARHLTVEAFAYDVSQVFTLPGAPSTVTLEEIEARLEAAEETDLTVLFLRAPNLAQRELRIDHLVIELLDHCDGRMTVDEIVATLADRLGASGTQAQGWVRTKVSAAFARLHGHKVIVFGERPPGGTWLDGAR